MIAAHPSDEPRDAPARQGLDRVAALAQLLSGADAAAVSLLDGDRRWFEARASWNHGETPRALAFCARALGGDQVLWVEDAAADPRFSEQPEVLRGQVRFYAGAPIVTAEGSAGVLCVFDSRPQAFDPTFEARLRELAALAADLCGAPVAPAAAPVPTPAPCDPSGPLGRVIAAAPISMAVTDRELRVVHVSDRWCQLHGRPAGLVVGRSMHDLFPAARERWEPVYRRSLDGAHERADRPGRWGMDDDRWFHWEVAPWRDPGGAIGGLLLMDFDVTGLAQAHEGAERSEQRLKLALDIADLVVWELGFEDRSVQWTGSPEKIFDAPPAYEDLAGDKMPWIHPEDRPRVRDLWRRHLSGEAPHGCEYRVAREDGTLIWVSERREVVRDAEGRPEGVVGVLKDITAGKVWEIETARAREAAETANLAKSEFLANISHEIRTPLNGVLGVATALGLTPLQPEQAEMVALIESSANSLERLLSDILDLARVEAGRIELREEPFDLRDFLHELGSLFAPEAARKGLTLDVRIPGDEDARCLGDAVRLRQVLANLLSNAIKFTDTGRVTLTLEHQVLAEQVRARFVVEDTGIGFDPEDTERLFERFEQADGSITRRFGGTGLGLAICRALSQCMGGQLEAKSELGAGSAFTFTVLLRRDLQAARADDGEAVAA